MALRQLSKLLRCRKSSRVNSVANYYATQKIGKREVVGYGFNGSPCYVDCLTYPMPAVRFKEDTEEIKALREKEKCHWSKLTVDEKKTLYRSSFCMTFSEMKATTGVWKYHLGIAIWCFTIALWIQFFYSLCLFNELPHTFGEEYQKAQLRRMIDLEVNPVTGLASKWDYEKNKWK